MTSSDIKKQQQQQQHTRTHYNTIHRRTYRIALSLFHRLSGAPRDQLYLDTKLCLGKFHFDSTALLDITPHFPLERSRRRCSCSPFSPELADDG
jgi:hypothetical protein